MKPTLAFRASLLGALVLTGQLAWAQTTYYWDSNSTTAGFGNTAGTWGSSTFWSTSSAGTGATANTTITSADTINFGTATLSYGTSNVGVVAGGVTVGGIVMGAGQTTAINLGTSGNSVTIHGGGITKNAGSAQLSVIGPVILGAAQTWTNNSTTSLLTSNSTNLINTAGFQLTIDGTGHMRFGTVNQTPASLTGSGALVKNGSGLLEIGGQNNAYTGNITINDGTLNYGDYTQALGSGNNIQITNGLLEARWNGGISRTQGSGADQIQITGGVSGLGGGGSAVSFNIGNITWGSSTFNPTEFILQCTSSTATLTNNIDLNGATRTIRSNRDYIALSTNSTAGSGIFSGNITNGTGTAGIIKTGIGHQVFSGTNTYNGSTAVNQGMLTATATTALPGWNSSGMISVASGATIGVRTSGWTAANIDTLRSNVTWGGSTAALGFEVTTGTFTYDSSVSGTHSIMKYGAGTLNLDGDLTALGGSIILADGTIGRSSGNLVTSAIEARHGTISANIGGSTAVTKTTAGVLVLSGSNNYSGGFTLNAGQVNNVVGTYTGFGSGLFTVNGTTGNLRHTGNVVTIANNVRFNAGSTLSVDRSAGVSPVVTWQGDVELAGNATFSSGGSTSAVTSIFEGDISGAFTLTYNATRTNENVLTLSGNNTFSGGFVTSGAGVLNINSATALGTGTFTHAGGGNLDNTSGNAITLSNNNAQNWNSNFTFVGSNDLNLGTGAVTINGTRTVTVNGGRLTVGGNISGEFGFVKAGAGTLTLNGTGSTFATNAVASISITGGTLEVAKLSNKGQASSIGNANTDYSLRIGNGATLRYIGTGDSTDYRFQYAGGGTATIESSGSGALNFTSTATLGAASTNTAQTLILGGTNTGNNSFSQQLSNNGTGVVSLTKEGAGKWVLANTTNNYTGATTVNNGILEVGGSGALTGTSGVTVNGGEFRYNSTAGLTRNVTLNGGTFRYNSATAYTTGTLDFTSGTLAGTNWNGSLDNQTIGANQTLAPGNSPGTAATGSQTWAAGGTYQWEINSTLGTAGADPGWDLIDGTGTLNITATAGNEFTIDITSLTLGNLAGLVSDFNEASSYSWLIAEFATISGFDATDFILDDTNFANTYTGTFGLLFTDGVTDQIHLTYTAIPEPATALLGCLGLLLILRRRR